MNELAETIRKARLRLLKMHFESRVGHIGGNLSALDIMITLHHAIMTPDDVFILSKGHAAGALYITLWSLGKLTDKDLANFHQDRTHLSGHPAPNAYTEIPFATGSLGHGLALATGIAMGKLLQKKPGRVWCLTSDGEWNEGSNWEALAFMSHHRPPNLCFIVDNNGLQGIGTTQEVMNLDPLADKFRTFNLQTLEIDGHDPTEILDVLADFKGPLAVVAKTVKGRGVSFMENKMEWHYLPMNAEQYAQAVSEIDSAGGIGG